MLFIDSSRLPATPWSGTVGVSGGIPTGYTQYCNVRISIPGTNLIASGNGINDDTAALQVAFTGCSNNQYIYLPTGTYKLTNELYRAGSNPGGQAPYSIVLRGDGPSNTRLLNYASDGNIIAFYPSNGIGARTAKITGGNFRGSNSIQLSGDPGFLSSGIWGFVIHNNSAAGLGNVPTNSNAYMYACLSQMVKVTTITGNSPTVNFTPALNEGYNGDEFWLAISGPTRCGIEDLYLERMVNSGTHNIFFQYGQECWIKNVESVMSVRWHMRFEYSSSCEVRNCYLHDTWLADSDKGYGVGLYQMCCNNLIENNYATKLRHSFITEYGGQNNVFGYNYSSLPLNTSGPSTDYLMGDLIHHGGYPRYNLWEGNVGATLRWDAVLRGSDYNTAFRNQIQRKSFPATVVACHGTDIQWWSHSGNFQGNVYEDRPPLSISDLRRWGTNQDGYPTNITDVSNTNPIIVTAPGSNYQDIADGWWVTIEGVLGNTAANVTNNLINYIDADHFGLSGVAGNGTYAGGGIAYLGIDIQASGTAFLDGELELSSGTIWNTGNLTRTLPLSYYRATPPAAYSGYINSPWPSIGPDTNPVNGGNPAYWTINGKPMKPARLGSRIKIHGSAGIW